MSGSFITFFCSGFFAGKNVRIISKDFFMSFLYPHHLTFQLQDKRCLE